jgi:hypothetical protein
MSEHGSKDGHSGSGKPEPVIYEVQIDKELYKVREAKPTARALLIIASKIPPEGFALYKKGKGGQPERIPLDQEVDLTDPGIERFVTLPLDQTEGLGCRRDFEMPEEDRDWLASLGLHHELVNEANVLRVVIYAWPVPPGFDRDEVNIHVRIEPGYPDTQIDMAYFDPPLARADGRGIGAICAESFDGKIWQRWSRHRTPANPWRPGIDSLETHFALVDDWLARELTKS